MSSQTKKRILNIRVYCHIDNEYTSHSYCVDDFPLAVSLSVGEIQVDPTITTLKQLRELIEFNQQGHMMRRSALFQEILFIMSKLPMVYPRKNKSEYRFGYLNISETSVEPIVIPEDKENQSILSSVPNNPSASLTIYIIPLTQVNIDA